MYRAKPVAFYVDSITIRALTLDDWKILRDMRIRAVEMHTGYFLGQPEALKKHSSQYWMDTLNGQNKQVFGLFDHDQIIGITAIFQWKDDPKGLTGDLAFNFIEPDYRGRGLSNLFYKVRLKWALENTDWTKIVTGHREGNEASRCAILRNGFTFTHKHKRIWPDGGEDWDHEYMLDLEALRN